MSALKSFLTKLRDGAFTPVDIASLVFFRIAFGLLMAWDVWRYWTNHWIAAYWLQPRFLFKYPGFSWVLPWSGNGLYIHWVALGLFALLIAAGFLYRFSTVLFFLSYTYFFLLDEGRYVNHAYLICLFSFLLIFMPANCALSVDAWLNPKLRSQTTPAWTLWLLRLQMGVTYFFAGVAKLSSDWLHGEPMRAYLARSTGFPMLGRFFREEWAVYIASYGALLIDLLIVPFLLWRRTRIPAFYVAVIFHLLNMQFFSIDVFPWLAIAATALFFEPHWPRRVLSAFRVKSVGPAVDQGFKRPSLWQQRLGLGLMTLYAAIQIFVPLRHFLYPGGVEWWCMEHRFSWQMMLRLFSIEEYFYVTDPNVERTVQVSPLEYLSERQILRMGWRPDMILQFARYLATVMPRAGPKPLRVEARSSISLNGRKPQLFLDPNVDLAAEPITLGRPRCLLQVHDPLPPPRSKPAEDSSASTLDAK